MKSQKEKKASGLPRTEDPAYLLEFNNWEAAWGLKETFLPRNPALGPLSSYLHLSHYLKGRMIVGGN